MEQARLWKIIQNKSLDKLKEHLKLFSEDEKHHILNISHRRSGDSAVHLMARHGCLDMLQLAHEYSVSLEQVNLDKKTSLHEAAAAGHSSVVQYLLLNNVKVDPLKHAGWSPLMMACTKQGNLDVISLLTDAGANLNLTNKDGWTCFHIACRAGDMDVVKYLHTKNLKLSQVKSNNQRTPLHTAALHGQYDVVVYLLSSCKISPNIRDACGSLPIMDAVRSGHLETIKLLAEMAPQSVHDTDKIGRNCLHVASEAGATTSICYLITKLGMNPNLVISCSDISEGQTALHLAFKEGNSDAVSLLIKLGASSDVKDKHGLRPSDLKLQRIWKSHQ